MLRRCALVLSLLAAVLVPIGATAQDSDLDQCRPAPPRFSVADERIVEILTPAGRIQGTLPGPADGTLRARVLMLHGYTGSRNEIPVARGEGMFARTARAFAERGIVSLRIDFIGSGRSDGEWSDTRFSTQARDAVTAAQWLLETTGSSTAPLGILGYSQGGLVGMRAAAIGGFWDRLALWNPVMAPMATYGIIFGEDVIRTAAQGDAAGDVVAGTRLRPGFFQEIVAADPAADAAATGAPILIVTGQRDPLVRNGAALAAALAERRDAETQILDLDAGHDLGAINKPALLDKVIACTAAFLMARPQP